MTWIDVLALALLALGVIHGWRAGFIVTAGNLASLIVSVVASAWLFSWLSGRFIFANWHIEHPILAVMAFILVFLVVTKLLRLAVRLLNAAYRIISVIPGMGLLNRILGGVVGLAQAAVILILATYIFQNFILPHIGADASNSYIATEQHSPVYQQFERAAQWLPQLGIWV